MNGSGFRIHTVSTSDTKMLKFRFVNVSMSPIFSRPCSSAGLSVHRRHVHNRSCIGFLRLTTCAYMQHSAIPTILWKVWEPQPKSPVVRPESMLKVPTPSAASASSSLSSIAPTCSGRHEAITTPHLQYCHGCKTD
jgi:hypothetical protein